MYSRRYTPFEELESIREQINQAFEPVVRSFTHDPRNLSGTFPLELTESPDFYTLRASIPGVAPERIDVQATHKTLSIAYEAEQPEAEKEAQPLLKEFRYGKYRRSLEFEAPIVSEDIQASYQNGILTLKVPKEGASRNKSVKIDVKTS